MVQVFSETSHLSLDNKNTFHEIRQEILCTMTGSFPIGVGQHLGVHSFYFIRSLVTLSALKVFKKTPDRALDVSYNTKKDEGGAGRTLFFCAKNQMGQVGSRRVSSKRWIETILRK